MESLQDFIKAHYETKTALEIANLYGCSIGSVKNNVFKLGLKKENKTRFKTGHTPANKGKKQLEYMSQEAIEKSSVGRYKKGQLPTNTKYDGHERIDADGYTMVRVSVGNYMQKHRYIWQCAHGPIPKNHIVIFVDGNRQNIVLENLKLITFAENAERSRQTDGYIANTMSFLKENGRGKINRELRAKLLENKELLELKRNQLHLNKTINESIRRGNG